MHAYNTERPHGTLEYAIPDAVYYGMFAARVRGVRDAKQPQTRQLYAHQAHCVSML